MDQVTWGAVAFVLTALCGGYTWWAFRHRGATAGIRGAAITLLPPAVWLTGTLKMFARILDAIVAWATHFVFSPAVWLGVVLAGVSVLLFGVAGRMGGRGSTASKPVSEPEPSRALGAAKGRAAPAIDDDLSEIEAILKKRGIN